MLRHEAGRGGHHSAIEYRDYTQTIDARVEVDGAGAVVPVRLAVPRDWQETTAPDVYPHHWWSLDFALTPAGNEPNLAVTFPTLPVFQTPR